MKTKSKKYVYRLKKIAVFDLMEVKINANLLVKLLDVFKMQKIVVWIESLSTNQGLYKVIKEYELDDLIVTLSSDGKDADIVFTCMANVFKEMSDAIVSGNPEIMLITDMKSGVHYKEYLDRIRHFNSNELLVRKMSDCTLSAMFDEHVVSFSFSTNKYDVSVISKYVREKIIKPKKNSFCK